MASFIDSFTRDNTTDGSLGDPSYTIYGPYAGSFPLPLSPYGKIQDKRVTADINQIIYSTQKFSNTITRIGANVSWVLGPGGSPPCQSSLALLLPKDGNIVNNIGVHLSIMRNNIDLKKMVNGVFSGSLGGASVSFGNAGAIHKVEAAVYPNSRCQIFADDVLVIDVTDPDILANVGPYAVWEVYNPSPNMIDLGRFESVWASSS